MGLASASGSRILLAVCLFDGLCERLMGLSSVSGSRILLAVFVCVSFSGCLCVCHSRCGCVVCVLCCVWVCRVCVLPLRAPWQLGRLGSSADVGTATQLPKPRKEAGTPAKQCAPSLPDGAAAAQTMQPRLLHRPLQGWLVVGQHSSRPAVWCDFVWLQGKGQRQVADAGGNPMKHADFMQPRSSPVMSSSGRRMSAS